MGVISATLRRDGTPFQAQFDVTRAAALTKQEADKDVDAIAEILDHSISVQLDVPEQFSSPEESDEAVSEIVSTPGDQSSLEEISEEAPALETAESSRPTLVESASLMSLHARPVVIPSVALAPKGKKSKRKSLPTKKKSLLTKKKSLLTKKKKRGTKSRRSTGLRKKGTSKRVSRKEGK